MKLQLVTLSGTKVDEDVYEAVIPTTTGEIAVYPGHEPLVTLAKSGVIQVRRLKSDEDNRMELFAISGGVVQIDSDKVRVLVDEADHGDDIIEAETQKALERAMAMKDNAKDEVELEKASALVDRHKVRLKVADLRRHHRNRPQ